MKAEPRREEGLQVRELIDWPRRKNEREELVKGGKAKVCKRAESVRSAGGRAARGVARPLQIS